MESSEKKLRRTIAKHEFALLAFALQALVLLQIIVSPPAYSAEELTLISPLQGSTLIDTRQSFIWQIDDIDESWIYLGSTEGSNDIHNSGNLGPASGADVSALPNDGRTVYLRLFYRVAELPWEHRDYTFQAHTGPSAIELMSPSPESTLAGTQQAFTWRGDGIDEWWLYLGSSAGGSDIYNSGNLESTTSTTTSTTVAALPHDGRTIFVRLFYRQTGATWRVQDYTLTAHTGDSAISLLSPTPGSTVLDSSVSFTWQGADIDEWWLYVGSDAGRSDIHNSGNLGSITTTTAPLLPVNTNRLYVRLFYRQHTAAWRHVDFSFIASPPAVESSTNLIALHYDVSPDLDDLQAIAAGANLSDKFDITPAVVIGAYGLVGLGGPLDSDLKYLYDTATDTLGQGPDIGETRQQKAQQVTDAAYGAGTYIDTGNGWTDAVNAQAGIFWSALQSGQGVSVADGGPMDFTADVLRRLQSFHLATAEQLKRVTVVQHSLGFNVSRTLPANRSAVSTLATYVTIDNGNIGGNATANLEDSNTNTTSSDFARWARNGNSKAAAWNSALDDFTAKIDFSDTVEYLHILNIPLSSVSDIQSFSSFID